MKESNERNAAIRFLMKLFLLLIPFIISLGIYLFYDPFMVLKHYDRYDNSTVILNEGYVGWQMYMNNRDSIPYDSYIMGNSCTMAYPCREWEKHLNGGRAIRLFGNAETIAAVAKKLQALDNKNAKIKNLLLILDKESLHATQLLKGYSYILPPDISGMSNLSFQEQCCQAFLFPKVFFPYMDYKIFHKYRPYMNGVINIYGPIRNPITNDIINPREKTIKKEGEVYWENQRDEFIKTSDKDYRNGKYKEAGQLLKDEQIRLLQEIKNICSKHKTSIKIIISPDYHQVNINPTDVKTLKQLFGIGNVFDFTGINEYTNDIHNYYEKGHYRPILGIRLMEKVYGIPSPTYR